MPISGLPNSIFNSTSIQQKNPWSNESLLGDFSTNFNSVFSESKSQSIMCPSQRTLTDSVDESVNKSSIDDPWECFSTSPNSAFLNGCQSPTFINEGVFSSAENFAGTPNKICNGSLPIINSTPVGGKADTTKLSNDTFFSVSESTKDNNFSLNSEGSKEIGSNYSWQSFADDSGSNTNFNLSQNSTGCRVGLSVWAENLDNSSNKMICS